jgi:hypothetical protein
MMVRVLTTYSNYYPKKAKSYKKNLASTFEVMDSLGLLLTTWIDIEYIIRKAA